MGVHENLINKTSKATSLTKIIIINYKNKNKFQPAQYMNHFCCSYSSFLSIALNVEYTGKATPIEQLYKHPIMTNKNNKNKNKKKNSLDYLALDMQTGHRHVALLLTIRRESCSPTRSLLQDYTDIYVTHYNDSRCKV